MRPRAARLEISPQLHEYLLGGGEMRRMPWCDALWEWLDYCITIPPDDSARTPYKSESRFEQLLRAAVMDGRVKPWVSPPPPGDTHHH